MDRAERTEDYRTTGATTRFLLPHPIAALYAQVHAVPEPSLRYGYYLRLAEGVFKFLGLLQVADAIACGAPDAKVRDWLKMIESPSLGKLLALNKSCGHYLKDCGGGFLEETNGLFDADWEDLTRLIPKQRNYYAHRLFVVSDAEARERLPALREPVHRLLSRVQFLQRYLFGVVQRADATGRRSETVAWRLWWSPSRGLSEIGEVMDLPSQEVWPVGTPVLLDPRSGQGLCLGPFFRWDAARRRIDWVDGMTPKGILYRHPIVEDPPDTPIAARPYPDPHGEHDTGLDRDPWLARRADACFRFPLGLAPHEREVLSRGALAPALGKRWEVRGELGRGAMGVVLEARDELIGDRVALKLMHDHLLPSREHVLRFLQEARVMRSLRHPGLVRVHDIVMDGVRPVLVMEHIEGEDLGAALYARGPLEPMAAAEIVACVLDALDHAHSHAVIHRDVKPRNVMRCADGSVKLLDFGVARALSDEGLTRADTVSRMGTDAYMAPEQRLLAQVDARSDIYGAGRLLYALVVGSDPPTHLPGLGTRAPRIELVRPETPRWLCEVYDRATHDDATLRFPSAAAMAEALRARGRSLMRPAAEPGVSSGQAPESAQFADASDPAPALVRRRLARVNAVWLIGLAVVLLRYLELTVWPDPRDLPKPDSAPVDNADRSSPTAAP